MKKSGFNITLKSRLGILTCFLILTIFACKDSGTDNTSNIAFINADVSTPSADLFVNGEKLNETPVDSGEFSTYQPVESGLLNTEIRAGNNLLASDLLRFDPSRNYSVFLINRINASEVFATLDNTAAPEDGKSKIRFVHLSADASDLNLLYTADSSLITGQKFKTASTYQNINPGNYRFVVINTDTTLTYTLPAYTIEQGKAYSVITKGFKSGVNRSALKAFIMNNN